MNLGTQDIMGSTDWEVTAGKGIITRTGHLRFTIQYIQATVVLSQKLDTRNRPEIKDLQFEVGNIQVIIVKPWFEFCLYHSTKCFIKGAKRWSWHIRLRY